MKLNTGINKYTNDDYTTIVNVFIYSLCLSLSAADSLGQKIKMRLKSLSTRLSI